MDNIFESIENINTPEAIFKIVSDKIQEEGLNYHRGAHDQGGRDPKTYHTSEHPIALLNREELLADTLNLSSEQRAVVNMAIAWHDTVIKYNAADPKNILAMISRHRGARKGDMPSGAEGNEAKSAQLLEQALRKANGDVQMEIFTQEQIQNARWAIDVTYPDVDLGHDFKGAAFESYPYYDVAIRQNQDLGDLLEQLRAQGIMRGSLFFQPHLEKPLEEGRKIPKEVLTVALVDLGAVGLEDREVFFKEGDDEMRELYVNLRQPEVMKRLVDGDEDADRSDREKVSNMFLNWLDSQLGFAVWQTLRFEKILYLLRKGDNITLEEEQGLRSLFSHFIDNARGALERSQNIKGELDGKPSGSKEVFRSLASKLHYEIQS